eukprot:1846500-Rhodomonas_salina.1
MPEAPATLRSGTGSPAYTCHTQPDPSSSGRTLPRTDRTTPRPPTARGCPLRTAMARRCPLHKRGPLGKPCTLLPL